MSLGSVILEKWIIEKSSLNIHPYVSIPMKEKIKCSIQRCPLTKSAEKHHCFASLTKAYVQPELANGLNSPMDTGRKAGGNWNMWEYLL